MLLLILAILCFLFAFCGLSVSLSDFDLVDAVLILAFVAAGVLLARAWAKRRKAKKEKAPRENKTATHQSPSNEQMPKDEVVCSYLTRRQEPAADNAPAASHDAPVTPVTVRITTTAGRTDSATSDENKRPLKGSSILQPAKNYVVVDAETTGLDPRHDEIIEIAALRVRNHEAAERFASLVKPQQRISDRITELTGITNEMVQDAPSIGQVLPDFRSFVGGDLIVGHNVNFDINFLYDNSEQCGLGAVENNYLDTLRLSRRLYPEEKHHRLEDLVQRFGVGDNVEHRAMSDVLQTKACYDAMRNDMQARGITMKPPVPTYTVEASNLYNRGEQQRKAGNLDEALSLFDAAAGKGFVTPGLYTSYAMVYRKEKEYQKEIDIIDKGIDRLEYNGWPTADLEERREKAVQLMEKAQADLEAAQSKEEKRQARLEKERLDALEPKEKKPKTRPVLQLDDNMTLIQRYESVTEAARACNITPKGIRDAATGVQKHAGGFCWKYEEQDSE